MKKVKTPFFVMNPKSYLYGEELKRLALKAEELAERFPEITMFFTAPYAELAWVAKNTRHLIVTAQHMDGIKPGRGMGMVLPESLIEVGARAVFLNHAERPMTIASLTAAMKRAKELELITVVCADSVEEAKAIAVLGPDILLCEPTEQIGTGVTSDDAYLQATERAIRGINSDILIMQAAGISSGEDVYRVIASGADGTGGTSGILKAPDPRQRLEEMIIAMEKAREEAKQK